jgi:glycine/D-amino acid oxidase-like deaminating enzyme
MLRAIAPQQLGKVWGWVRNGLLACVAKAGGHYLPEDVYAAIKTGGAFLFAVEWRGDDVGFVVLEQQRDPDGPVLFVFAAWFEPGAGVVCESEFVMALESKAREIGARRMRMQSARKGWDRRKFFKPVATLFEVEL